MPALTHISFDLDETLFDFARTLNDALQAVTTYLQQTAGIHISPLVQQTRRTALFKSQDSKDLPLLELRRLSLTSLLKKHPDQTQLVTGAMEIFEKVRFTQIYLFPDAEAVLRRLSKSYTLTAVTNGNTDPETTVLRGLFKTVVSAETCGVSKPDPRIFDLMRARTGNPDPSSVLHVGDSLHSDVEGANEAGLTSVWYNPTQAPNTTDIAPTYELAALRDLPALAQHHGAL